MPGFNCLDTICNPGANIMFLDAARASETIIAHEIGHAWIQYVDQAEDMRILKGTRNPQLINLLNHIQSFVLNLRVNEIIGDKGFDMSQIIEDRLASVASLSTSG